ncbi:unnamed protein product, partial [Rotaria magnacalcarata]
MKLQKQNFHRLLSSAASTTSSISTDKQQVIQINLAGSNSRTTATSVEIQSTELASDTQRAVLHQRKQALMKAIQSIN